MSVTIRLARIGKRNAPAYKIVVANTRDKRNGRFLDILGHYNPSHTPALFDIDKDKVSEWKKKGALSTDAVEKLLAGTYKWEPYTRQNEVGKEEKERKVDPRKAEKAKKEKEDTKPETKKDEPAESSETPKE
jgi:small subunit ribosomal protein S16